jgi:hypothetical protein
VANGSEKADYFVFVAANEGNDDDFTFFSLKTIANGQWKRLTSFFYSNGFFSEVDYPIKRWSCRIECKLYPGVTGTLASPAAVHICEWLVLPDR